MTDWPYDPACGSGNGTIEGVENRRPGACVMGNDEMRDVLVFDCSGSMVGGHAEGASPLRRLVDHAVATRPPSTPWIAVSKGRLHRGTLANVERVLEVWAGSSEIMEAMEMAFAPGMRPVLCTDEIDDLKDVARMASGREMEVVIASWSVATARAGSDPRLGRVTYI